MKKIIFVFILCLLRTAAFAQSTLKQTFEAEEATLSGVTVATAYAGFSGEGYADFSGTTGAAVFLEWDINSLYESTTQLTFWYTNGDWSRRPLRVLVNGVDKGILSFASTRAWDTYTPLFLDNIALKAGSNKIRLVANAGSVGGNVDRMEVKWLGKEIKNYSEAESGTLTGGTVVKNTGSGFQGTGFVDFPDAQGANVTLAWTLSETKASKKAITIRYANGGTTNRPLALIVNGTKVITLAFAPTGGWNTWSTVSFAGVSLTAGSNTIALSATEGAAGANIDQWMVSYLEDIAAKTVHVYLLGGQSNMAGRNGTTGTFPAALQVNQDVQIKVFGETDRPWGPVKPGLARDDKSSGPELVFAWDMSNFIKDGDLALLKGATGGTNLYVDWRPSSLTRTGDEGILYDEYIHEVLKGISELKATYDNVSVDGLCWMQGETDAENNTHANAYEANLTALLNDFRADFNLPNLPVVLGRTDDTPTLDYRAAVRAGQVNVASNMRNVYVFSTDDYNSDGLHYFISGYLRLGADFAMVMNNRISPLLSDAVAVGYKECGFNSTETRFNVGDYTTAAMTTAGMPDNTMSSLKTMAPFKALLYDGNNYQGTSVTVNNESCLGTLNKQTSSLKVQSAGVTGLSGTFLIKNRFSQMYMGVQGSSVDAGAKIVQHSYSGGEEQKFKIEQVLSGIYTITPLISNKRLNIPNGVKSNGVEINQSDANGTTSQQFILVKNSNGSYSIFSRRSGLALEVSWKNSNGGGVVVQRGNGSPNYAQWDLEYIGTGNGLRANYFNGKNFETPVFSRVDQTIDFNWGSGSPDASVNTNSFSARWTGQLLAKATATYTFYIHSDNGRRLWVNNQLIIDQWLDDAVEYSGTIALTAGQKYDIRLEYFENTGTASNQLSWSTSILPKEIIPQTQLYANALPTISISSPTSNQTYTAPASIAISASAADADGSIEKVEFYNGTIKLGEDNTSPYTYTWTNSTPGTYALTARAIDNSGGVTVSSLITVKVNANSAPSVSITSPLNNASFTAVASVMITANAADAEGTVEKVEFYNGTTKIGEDLSNPYSYTWTGVTAGDYVLTAKAIDNLGSSTISVAVNMVVNEPITTDNNVAEKEVGTINLYPNPASSVLYVTGDIERVEVYYTTGVIVMESIVNAIDISRLDKGLYLVKVYANGRSISKVFTKE